MYQIIRRRRYMFAAVVAVAACCVSTVKTFASGCNQVVAVPIHFQSKNLCWRYIGMGNTFVGTFAAGQRVTASAIGESYSSDSNGRLLVEP
jgi:hypothetical protein